MRTTLDLDDDLLEDARSYLPRLTKTALLEEALRALVQREARRRILAGALHEPGFEPPSRRKVP